LISLNEIKCFAGFQTSKKLSVLKCPPFSTMFAAGNNA
jgi:hypothetical protein